MITNKELGIRIKEAREKKGLTQEQLADELHISKQAVSNWERGINRIDEQTREKLEKIFRISLAEPYRRKAHTHMVLKALNKFEDLDELMNAADYIVANMSVDVAYASSVRKLLVLTLGVVLGYEIYKKSFERKKYEDVPLGWTSVSDDLFSLLNNDDPYPLPDRRYDCLDRSAIFAKKIEYITMPIGQELMEDIGEDGFKNGFIQQVGRVAESYGYNLLSLIPEGENSLKSSFRIAIFQMAEDLNDICFD